MPDHPTLNIEHDHSLLQLETEQAAFQAFSPSATLSIAEQIAAARKEVEQLSLLMHQIVLNTKEVLQLTELVSASEIQLTQATNRLDILYELAESEMCDACMAKARMDANQPKHSHDDNAEPVAVWAPRALAAKQLGNLTAVDLVTVWGVRDGPLSDSRPPASYFATSIHDQRDAVLYWTSLNVPNHQSLIRIFRYVYGEEVGTAAAALLSRMEADAAVLEELHAYERALVDAEAHHVSDAGSTDAGEGSSTTASEEGTAAV